MGHASLRRFTTENRVNIKQIWYVGDSDAAKSAGTAHPAPGLVVDGDFSSPRGYLRSSSPNGTDWEAWSNNSWMRIDVRSPSGDGDVNRVRLRCVNAAFRCRAGRLYLSGLPGGERTPTALKGSLLGIDQPPFPKDPVVDDDPSMTVAGPLPATTDTESNYDIPNRLFLGTFLMTNTVHMNRPVYHQAGSGDSTFLYFDYLNTSNGKSTPLWIVGQQPGQVDLEKSRLFFAVDSAARPEEITVPWAYLAGGRQSLAQLNVTCEHGRTPAGPLNGADCDFELPGACGYRIVEGQLSQEPYSEDQPDNVRAAGDAFPGRFFAQVTAPEGGSAEVFSKPFEAATNSCVTLYYRMKTDAFFKCKFSLVSETDDTSIPLFTMTSAAREWMRIQRNVPAGRFSLHVSTNELVGTDQLQMDSVRVTPGSCEQYTKPSPCSQQPCENGGTCLPTGLTTYTCLCRGQFQDRNCRRSAPCPPPPKISHGAAQLVPAPEDSLPTARYSCRPEFELREPLVRSRAVCIGGQWRGMPECRRVTGEPAEVGPGGSAVGKVPSMAVPATTALAVLTAARAGL